MKTTSFLVFAATLAMICATLAAAETPPSPQLNCELHGQAFYSKNARTRSAEQLPPSTGATFAAVTPTWKTISIGSQVSVGALRDALRRKRCRVGPIVAELLDHPDFNLGKSRERVQLVTLSAAELGFQEKSATLSEIYGRATKLGYELCPAEIGPQLRLQYMTQPLGEFLHIAMPPIVTHGGQPTILAVANGGEGLILIGSNGHPDFKPPLSSRFVFVKPQAVAAR